MLKLFCKKPFRRFRGIFFAAFIVLIADSPTQAQQTSFVDHLKNDLADTTVPTPTFEDLSLKMEKGISQFLDKYRKNIIRYRNQYWHRSFLSDSDYQESIQPNRKQLRKIIGAVDSLVPIVKMESFTQGTNHSTIIAETDQYFIQSVRWTVIKSQYGTINWEGLLLSPKGKIKGNVIALSDPGQIPEDISGLTSSLPPSQQYARKLAESGLRVLVPTPINRKRTFTGSDYLLPHNFWKNHHYTSKWTRATNRNWIYRMAYQMGRHVIGFEVEQAIAAINWFQQRASSLPIGIVGYGGGGLVALYTAAIDKRVKTVWVSGYFRQHTGELWKEPVYRNIWGLLKQFDDAEIASLIVPRSLIIEYSKEPLVKEPALHSGQKLNIPEEDSLKEMPNRLNTPSLADVQQEIARLRAFFPDSSPVKPDVSLVYKKNNQYKTIGPGSTVALNLFLDRLGSGKWHSPNTFDLNNENINYKPQGRQERIVKELTNYLEKMVQLSDFSRYQFIDGDLSSPEEWDQSMEKYRDYLWDEILGRLPEPTLSPNPSVRKIWDEKQWKGYLVMLDLYPGVFTYGILAVPKDIKPGESRPVVVTQHGASGLPNVTFKPKTAYHSFAGRLADQGFVVFAPANPIYGHYRILERKSNPLKLSVFSFVLAANQQILKWLKGLNYVDSDHIGFYGLSWGGRTAIRVGALLKDYTAVIQSGDFNRWNLKLITTHYRTSYMYSDWDFDTYEFNLGNTFGHAEMAGLIAPRPFMVEAGYSDAVAPTAWVGYEFSKVQRLYDLLNISERVRLDTFKGVHEIHGKDDEGTFHFLHQYLHWNNHQTK